MKKKFHALGALQLPSGQDMTSELSMLAWYYYYCMESTFQLAGKRSEESNQHNKRVENKPYESR
jgi:hypothetical protein